MNPLRLYIAAGLFWVVGTLCAQDTIIRLKNPSFEPEDYAPLFKEDARSWVDCGFLVEEPPSIQPGAHEVKLEPQHKKGYLSMVVRDNNTWDAVGQELVQPLKAGKCYKFSLYMANSEKYFSSSRKTGNKVNYRNPIRLLIWGGKSYCEAGYLLAKTDLVKNNSWEPYSFVFQPTAELTHLTLHAYYLNPMSLSYNGNILLDNASDIVECPCEAQNTVAEEENWIELKPRSLEELKNFIQLHGEHIVFRDGSNQLLWKEEENLFDPRNWSQIYFSVIGKSLQYFPEQQLVIGVKATSKRQLERRIQFLEEFLKKRGIEPTAYRCVEMSEKIDAMKWLSANKNVGLYLETKSKANNRGTSKK